MVKPSLYKQMEVGPIGYLASGITAGLAETQICVTTAYLSILSMEYLVCCTSYDLNRTVESLNAALAIDERHREQYDSHIVEFCKIE